MFLSRNKTGVSYFKWRHKIFNNILPLSLSISLKWLLYLGLYINDVTKIWRFIDPLPPLSNLNAWFNKLSYIVSQRCESPPTRIVTSFMNNLSSMQVLFQPRHIMENWCENPKMLKFERKLICLRCHLWKTNRPRGFFKPCHPYRTVLKFIVSNTHISN